MFGESGEVAVPVSVRIAYQQPDIVAVAPPEFGWGGGLQARRAVEREIGQGQTHSAPSVSQVSACARNLRPLSPDRGWPSSQAQKGRVTSGRGRSEISSPGNAS